MISVLFFGPVAERVGKSRVEMEFREDMCLQDLRMHLQGLYPEAFELVSLVAVNGSHERDMSFPLVDNSEIVFMSKFSGG